ncbi:MAG: signal recognition particle protein [Dehalococcoidia bacterium]|nr:signal recognition particle protein [Dehalococcoidia bacterium]
MFEVLTQRLSKVFSVLGSKGRLSEKDIDEALRQIRLALLEADVNFKVVKSFLASVKEQALTAKVLESLTPAQQIVKIVNEELINILGKERNPLIVAGHPPSIAMLVGLQGSGKTTTTAKLALLLKSSGQRPLLVAADTRRPAAVDQLVTLGKQLDIPVSSGNEKEGPLAICRRALKQAQEVGSTWVIIDTQGRLHIDEAMMKELAQLKAEVQPSEVLLVVDAMTGQDAVNTAEEFNNKVGLTGLILTKMDGDARGGAALSIKSVTGVPVKFIGTGEKANALEPFYPDRLASRILGMGDVLTLIEKAEGAFDAQSTKQLEKKIKSAELNLEDFLLQLRQIKKMGSLTQLVELLPGFSKLASSISESGSENQLRKIESIILSMTVDERRNPAIIGGSRRRRIAKGSGTTPGDVNQMLSQFFQMRKLAKMAATGRLPKNLLNTLKR